VEAWVLGTSWKRCFIDIAEVIREEGACNADNKDNEFDQAARLGQYASLVRGMGHYSSIKAIPKLLNTLLHGLVLLAHLSHWLGAISAFRLPHFNQESTVTGIFFLHLRLDLDCGRGSS